MKRLQVSFVLASLQHNLDHQLAAVVLRLPSHIERFLGSLQSLIPVSDKLGEIRIMGTRFRYHLDTSRVRVGVAKHAQDIDFAQSSRGDGKCLDRGAHSDE